MKRTKVIETSQAERDAMDEYLKGYGFCGKLIRLARYERAYFGDGEVSEDFPGEMPLSRARMFEVRHFLMELPNGDEKLLLYYHYIQGHSVERCAELLGIARASGYRLKKRALALAIEYDKKRRREWGTRNEE